MANGNKTGGKDFKPGVSGNPSGRPALPPELRQAKQGLKSDFENTVMELLKLPFSKLVEIAKDKEQPALRMSIASVLLKGISLGDPGRLNFLLDRLVGPVKSAVELSGPDGEPIAPVVAMSSQDLTATLIVIQTFMKEKKWSFPQSLPPGSESSPPSSRRGSRGA